MTSYLPLVEAVRAATGRQVHLSTVLRWCSRGARGRVLSSWMVGGRRMTTVEAVNAFIAAASEPEHLPRVRSRTSATRAAEALRSRYTSPLGSEKN